MNREKLCTIRQLVPGTTQHTFLPLWELLSRDLTVWSSLNNIFNSCRITFWFLLKIISERRAEGWGAVCDWLVQGHPQQQEARVFGASKESYSKSLHALSSQFKLLSRFGMLWCCLLELKIGLMLFDSHFCHALFWFTTSSNFCHALFDAVWLVCPASSNF
jgi:hypothetical protein